MGYQNLVVTSVLFFTLLLTTPAGPADLALIVVAALAAVVFYAHRAGALSLLYRPSDVGPNAEERHLRGSFRRQHRPDAPGRPQPRAPGLLVGAL
ncbi:hypothetical protein E4P29_21030 [Rhodococcus sp. 1R11]|uniref:DUF6412 domain-containing protein n=1 Tax=Rhodococcus sp. 1R11 TaxID=2559614 RepID=UPI001072321B|nr:DUF6412 domain-containing protein [Rhodococcus sp. 1R11]TFI41283.1 hypothetical protein E4P29_21030 [Rhodococcus sp. 1R11]